MQKQESIRDTLKSLQISKREGKYINKYLDHQIVQKHMDAEVKTHVLTNMFIFLYLFW